MLELKYAETEERVIFRNKVSWMGEEPPLTELNDNAADR